MAMLKGNLYAKARGVCLIFFLIFIMAVMKTSRFGADSMTGGITFDIQISMMNLILVLSVLAGITAVIVKIAFPEIIKNSEEQTHYQEEQPRNS